MGWFDGNPARLWPHPPAEQATRYVAAIGGIDRVVELARSAFDEGDFRWAATLLDHAIFTDEHHAAARELHADTLEQLGYGAENGTWRNFFLSGATELREGNFGTPTATSAPAILAQLTPEQLLDAIAISVDGPKAWDLDLSLNLRFTDLGTTYRVTLRNGVLIYREADADPAAAASVSVSQLRLLALMGGDHDSPGVAISGDAGHVSALLGVLDAGDPAFAIVTP
jgi:alkyl sulfatase BDS1-like metallo-beta-lactamase superfamily hydrolase